ncbi:MAG: hypothetical protein ABJN04_13055 [Hyphomicrobiales bacterium]
MASAASQETVNSTTANAATSNTAITRKSECDFSGSRYKAVPFNAGCLEWSFAIESGVAFNDPTDVIDGLPSVQYTGRSDIDIKWFKRTQIGTLSSFIRLQSQYDPGVSEDLILGAVERDFAVGLDAFQLKLDNSRGQFKLGKIENAGSVFIADGFTRRGAESLDARSALGLSYQTRIGGIDIVGSISDGSNTVSGSRADLPNFGLGVRKKFGAFSASFGLAAVSVDDFISSAPLPVAVRNGSQFTFKDNAELGYGFAAQLAYVHPLLAAHLGVTYALRSSNDIVFAFSDGLDAFSVFGGVTYSLHHNLRLNADFSYVTATQSGFRNENGIDGAVNIVWSAWKDTEILAEIGYDSVDNFGAGNEFFFANDNNGEVGGYLSIRRKF